MDYIDQRIQQLIREIGARESELGGVVSRLSARRADLDAERNALEKAQQNHVHYQRLRQQGQETLAAFNRGVTRQKAITNNLAQLPNSKVALSIARKSAALHDGADYKNTSARMDWAMQDVGSNLKRLTNEIQSRQSRCARLKSEIAELEGRRNHLSNRVIPQLQAELQRLRRQKLMAN
jgi:vacuolar-type H+-ATPase subunit D/Vma8